jgi:hypothetical protein
MQVYVQFLFSEIDGRAFFQGQENGIPGRFIAVEPVPLEWRTLISVLRQSRAI